MLLMRLFFWWKLGITQLIPRVAALLNKGTDRYKIVRMLYGAGFNAHEEHLKKHMEDHGVKTSYIEYVLLDQQKTDNLEPFIKLAEMMEEPSYFRSDYKYTYSKKAAHKLAKELRRAVHDYKIAKKEGRPEHARLWQNVVRTAILLAGITGFFASLVTILGYFK